jgi:hypothetical protein
MQLTRPYPETWPFLRWTGWCGEKAAPAAYNAMGAPAALPLRRSRISAVLQPSAVARMIRARQTCFCSLLRSETTASSRSRSLGPSRTATSLLPRPAPPSKTGFARSKTKAMDPEIARNQNYDNYYANDREDFHSALLPFHDDSVRRARSSDGMTLLS